ncbi:class IIb bacteriocin, lactobin A/cerein 7B family [Leuconostoc miyukkimchii]|uniref:class IIb bacteriocin, lactobin A/cerein 7B family n=1 Tax=Leuconostoc miyukkimchii TaxID=910540 RepID=UPI001C7D8EA6|nr:class IIb bacteriocin, lactobin A/cerein 7B family [Leuconostoc miyukkimchii]
MNSLDKFKELNTQELDDINGGIAPLVVAGAIYAGKAALGAGVFGAGLYAGYKFATKFG